MRRQIRPPQSQSATRISKRLEIQVLTLYNWRKAWQQKGGWFLLPRRILKDRGSVGKLAGLIESTDHNMPKLNDYYRERKLIPEQMKPWRKLSQDGTAQRR